MPDLLAINPRTLERRLKKENTSFTYLLEEVRQDLACKYIRNDILNLMEITFMLGYSEESAFSRAFKRWTGFPPSDYKANNASRDSTNKPV